MATRNKKENPQLPFTQLWQKHNNKSSQKPKPQAQKQKPRESLQLFSPDLYPNPKHRRPSLNQLSTKKQRAEISNSHQRISMMLLNRDKENWNTNCQGEQSCLSFACDGEKAKGNASACEDYSSIYERASNGKGKVGAQILQVIENNLVPFLVDKFLQLEEKTNKKIDKLEATIQLQNQQLQKLKQREKTLQQSLTLTKPHPHPTNPPPKKSLTETADSPEPQIQHISSLLEQLALTMERAGAAHGEQIEGLEKQVKKLADRQRAGQKKLEDEFAKRILELIQTYNDNFVDLDKRIGRVEQLVTGMGQGNRASKSQVTPISTATHADKQKTNRYDPTNS